MRNLTSSLWFVSVLAFLPLPVTLAQPPVSTLNTLVPAGCSQGQTTEVKLVGTFLDECHQLLFSHPGIKAVAKKEPSLGRKEFPEVPTGKFEVTVGKDVPTGIYEVWAVGRLGVSNSRPFFVSSEPQTYLAKDHTSLKDAADLPLNQWLQTSLKAKLRNFYRFQVAAGETISIVCRSASLDSRAIPYLVLRDGSGKEVARARTVGRSPTELLWVAEKGEEYSLVVHDFLYRGGEDLHYSLFRSTQVLPPGDLGTGPQSVAALGFSSWMDGSIPKMVHEESQTPHPAKITLPIVVRGKWERQGDEDSFEFDAKAGETIFCDVLSESLAQNSDPRLIIERVENKDGAQKLERLLVQDDQPNLGGPGFPMGVRDPRASLKIPADGSYRVTLRDLQSAPNAQMSRDYLLRIVSNLPNFEVIAYFPNPINTPATSRAQGAYLPRGGLLPIRLVARREGGYSGPIEISLASPPPGIECQSAIIASGQNETEVMLVSSEDAADFAGPIALKASASILDKTIEKKVAAATYAWDPSPERGGPQPRLASDLHVGIVSLDSSPLLIRVGDGKTIEAKQGEKVTLPIQAIRRAGGEVKCLLKAQNLPPKATLPDVPLEPKVNEGKGELQIAADTPVGEYTLWMLNEAKIKMKNNPQALEREEANRKKIQEWIADPAKASEKDQLEKLAKSLDQRIEQLKKDTAEKEYAVFWRTTPVRLRVLAK